MERKPVIGVIPLYDDEKESMWMLPGYFDGISASGAIPVMLPLNAGKDELIQLDKFIDGYLFTGGHDVNPNMYNEKKSDKCGIPCDARDRLERLVFDIAEKNDKPILGICRGIQIINALMGGTLYQDLPTEHKSDTEHHMTPPYDRIQHYDNVIEDTPLFELTGKEKIGVNSYHHQAIKELAESLEPMAVSEDGLIEAVSGKNRKFLWAVQWHPEFSYKTDDISLKIFKAFIAACN